MDPPRSLNAVRQRAARPPPPAVVPPKSPIKPNMHHAGPPLLLKHAMQEAVPPIPPPSPVKHAKREASPPRQPSASKYKLTAASYMQIIEAEEDRKHRLIDYSPSDGPSQRSTNPLSSKSILSSNNDVEPSMDILPKQAKTKVIKKEPVPKPWSPSQLRLKRLPPPNYQHVAPT